MYRRLLRGWMYRRPHPPASARASVCWRAPIDRGDGRQRRSVAMSTMLADAAVVSGTCRTRRRAGHRRLPAIDAQWGGFVGGGAGEAAR